MLNKSLIVIVIATVLFSTGCARTHLRADFGDANINNIDKQTLYPEAYKKEVTHTLSGEKAQKVIDRYNTEKSSSGSTNLIKEVSN